MKHFGVAPPHNTATSLHRRPSPASLRALSEQQELESAGELLEVTDGQELKQALTTMVGRSGNVPSNFGTTEIGRALVAMLSRTARQTLPVVGSKIGGPEGARTASRGPKLFGLELEGLSAEDAEFELARQFVRLTRAAARAAAAQSRAASPRAAAARALTQAAATYAPGLLTTLMERPRTWRPPPLSGPIA